MAVRDPEQEKVTSVVKDSNTPWAPLRSSAFRALWLAMSAAGAGAAMQLVGAQWLISGGSTGRADTGLLVALVQAASMLPVLLLGLPAGVLADLVDRRRLLIGVQLAIATVGLVLAGLAVHGEVASTTVLVLQCVIGAGAALTMPAFGSITPDLVPRRHLPHASALGAISTNVVRAVGPAVAGLLIAWAGAAAVFALHAVTVLVFVGVLIAWRPCPVQARKRAAERRPERFHHALRSGCGYVRQTPIVRRILGHALLFLLPGSALLALLPLLAGQRLGLGVNGYGMLLGALGAGAVAGALIQPRLRAVRIRDRIAGSAGVFLLSLVVVASSRDARLVAAVLIAAGAAWVIALACTNSAIESHLPAWVRARGLAVYQVVLFGAQGLGAIAWGCCAQRLGAHVALMLAAAGLGAAALIGRAWPMHDPAPAAPAPATA
ncbi:MFS transporter [Dactylosporangium sp. NPDC005572]|uniref:MFS transporter n=1 Tax=Dactylosporangium sp. NPDC005572 TaxID=3156889 RepID=UPI0033B9A238